MILTAKQEQGLRIAVQRFKEKQKYTVIGGYAGAGKSTLVRFIIEALDVEEENVCYATFTGKAAQVLLKKGNKNVRTLHKLLYRSFPCPDGTFMRIPVEMIPYDVIVVDEVSMAPKTLMNLLFKYNVHVICLGDPFQLPPVDKDEDNHLLDHPHIFLDEIMRQAQESEIIRLTMDIRAGKSLSLTQGDEVIVIPESELNTGMLQWADQVICATNATRVGLNNQMRAMTGKSGNPKDGDKVICLFNEWDIIGDNDDPLINGTIGTINNSFSTFFQLPRYVGGQQLEVLVANFESDNGALFEKLEMDKLMFQTGEYTLDWKTSYKLGKNPKTKHLLPLKFTYGYAITCHKSQGSEWDKVLVVEEKFPFDKEEHARWLYTAATRASEKLVIRMKG